MSLLLILYQEQPFRNRLVITGSQATPNEVYLGVHIQREDMAIPHEEANVINVNQVISAAKQGHKTIQVICDDTDVIVLLAHFYQSSTCYLYIVPTSTSENVINIGLTVQQHSEIVPHLISMHTFTGCDSVSSIFGIGKVKTLNTLKKVSVRHYYYYHLFINHLETTCTNNFQCQQSVHCTIFDMEYGSTRLG